MQDGQQQEQINNNQPNSLSNLPPPQIGYFSYAIQTVEWSIKKLAQLVYTPVQHQCNSKYTLNVKKINWYGREQIRRLEFYDETMLRVDPETNAIKKICDKTNVTALILTSPISFTLITQIENSNEMEREYYEVLSVEEVVTAFTATCKNCKITKNF